MKAEYKIIADHLRSSCFLIADGVLPSNEGRGYVLRRIMRRAMRQLHKLGAAQVTMYKFVPALIDEMGAAFPELARARDLIVETLKNEEEKFRETLEKGLKILEEAITKVKDNKFSGSIAFMLYDTYGFPLDLTQDILKEKNIEVDIEEFNREMEAQRERAKANWKGSGEIAEDSVFLDLKNEFGATKFLGYEKLEAKAKIIASTHNAIMLDQTPFYATSGGQKGDDGFIYLASDKNKFAKIFETKKIGGDFFVHFFDTENSNHKFNVGDEIIASVNEKTRASRAKNHSATHLLHKALKEVLGNSITQKGSNVDAEYFTFDFNFNRAMTPDEIAKVESLVNNYIAQKDAVKTEEMDLEKAKESGAMALFGEKYDSTVRVVSMGKNADKNWSVELCGGTHVKNTGDIEILKILSEKSVASGIRRIEAKTSESAKEYLANEEKKSADELKEKILKISELQNEISKIDSTKKFSSTKFDAVQADAELKNLRKELDNLKKKKLLEGLTNLKSEKVGEVNLLSHIFENLDANSLREITTDIKQRKEFNQNHIFVLFALQSDKVAVCVAATNDLLDKFDASKLIGKAVEAVGGKGGGGKKDLAMGGGTNKDGIKNAIEIIKNEIK